MKVAVILTGHLRCWKEVFPNFKEKIIDRSNGEFYVCPVFNEAIGDGKKIRVKDVPKMWGIGTPEDLNYFLEHYK